jgi:hypothetical protein
LIRNAWSSIARRLVGVEVEARDKPGQAILDFNVLIALNIAWWSRTRSKWKAEATLHLLEGSDVSKRGLCIDAES